MTTDQRISAIGRTRLTLAVGGVAAICAVAAPKSALASTVSVMLEPPPNGSWAGVEYDAAAGESNRVELFTVDDKTIRVTDAGAVITPGESCESLDKHTVRCTAGHGGELLLGADVRVGDMNDFVSSHGPALSADGGPGDDRLETVGRLAGTLNGGGGRDVLLGGTDRDTLIDGDRSRAADSDILDGREGGAVVSYAARTAPVNVDLVDPGPDGETGEGDVLRSVDHAIGGSADDVLRGTADHNSLEGRGGNDHLYGRDGDDNLNGGRDSDRVSGGRGDDGLGGGRGADLLLGSDGADELDGGPGPDRLRAGSGHDVLGGGTASCGRGYDVVDPSEERDPIRADCEAARFQMPTYTGRLEGHRSPAQPTSPRPWINHAPWHVPVLP